MTDCRPVTLDASSVEAVACRVVELLRGENMGDLVDAAELALEGLAPDREPWIGVDAAAEHLGCGRARIYALVSARRIPHERDGTRLLFKRAALDRWVAEGGGKRP